MCGEEEKFDVNAFLDGLDGTYDGDVSELDAELFPEEFVDEDDEPDVDELTENEDFEQADEYFGEHPI
jgi:hypothetical protein